MEKLFARMNVEVKETEESRVLEFIGSTDVIDRTGEVIEVEGWDLRNYKKNPVVLFGHDYRQPAIGRAQKVWIDDGKLKFRVEFAPADVYPFADTIYKLYKNGFMKATSVGFKPIEWKFGEKPTEPYRTFMKQELLEYSMVPVPANPEALIGAKELKDAWQKSVISDKEYEDFSQHLKMAFEKQEKPKEKAEKTVVDLEKELKDYQTATDDRIGKIESQIAELKDRHYLDTLLETDVRGNQDTPGEKLIKAVKSIKEN